MGKLGKTLAPRKYSVSQRPPNFAFRPVRTDLLKQLEADSLNRPKLLSVIAPVGYGKTVLMSGLYAHRRETGERCFWIGLDERHKSVDRFLSAFRLERPNVESDIELVQALLKVDTSIDQQVDQLLELLTELDRPTSIFIDNLNSCIDDRLAVILDALIFRTSSAIRFVWSSTSEPGFNVGRARLEGLVRQIGLAELSLNTDEVGELLGDELSLSIGEQNIKAIVQRTEGWPAAIRMAQIILGETEQPLAVLAGFSGTDEDIAALLQRQVMGRFSIDLQEFLLCLGQLRTFNLELCRYAIDLDESNAHLAFLLQRNVFMVPLDRNRRRYRLHGLFREYLLSEADRLLDPARRGDVLVKASQWCEQQQEWNDAIDYALTAGDLIAASRLLDRIAKTYVREQRDIQQYVFWVERVEGAGGTIGWETHFWYVWALVFQRRYEQGRIEHERLSARFHSLSDEAIVSGDFQLRIDHLRMCIDLFTDRLADAERAATRWILDEQQHDAYTSGSIRCIRSICLSSRHQFSLARETMLTAQPVLLEVGGPYTIGWISLIQGSVAAYEGDCANAYRDLMPAFSRARRELGVDAALCGSMACVAASCAVEMGQSDEAHKLLVTVLSTLQSNVLVDSAACGVDAAIKLWNGGADEIVSVSQLREVTRGYPPRLALMFSCNLIQRYIVLGDLDSALAEAEMIGMKTDGSLSGQAHAHERAIPRLGDLWSLTLLSLLLATSQFTTAEVLIERESEPAKKDGRHGHLVDLDIAKAAVAFHLGNSAGAIKAVTSAVRRAARRHIVRPFSDRREIFSLIIAQGGMSAGAFALSEEKAFFSELCVSCELTKSATEIIDTERADTVFVAPTRREAELLRLLDTGLSNMEIANYSNVSITTIKWHLKNLYRKLGVTNRAAALARARDVSLL